jgi:hypothetical protein
MAGHSVRRSRLQLQLQLQLRLLDQYVPALLRPLIRAYILGYASSTVPRLLTLLLTWLSKRKKISEEGGQLGSSIIKVLREGLDWHRFPTFCATLVGGSTLLQARDLFRLCSCLLTLYCRFRYTRCLRVSPLVCQPRLAQGELHIP